MDPNLEAILNELHYLVEMTSACKYIAAAGMIAVIGCGWRTLWRGVKITGDVLEHLRSKDWGVD